MRYSQWFRNHDLGTNVTQKFVKILDSLAFYKNSESYMNKITQS